MHFRDVADRVLRQCVVAHSEAERQAQHGAGLLCGAVALGRGELLDELVDHADGDLAQDVVLEGWHDELAHVALIESPSAFGKLARHVEVGEPDLDEPTKGAVRRQVAAPGGVVAATNELLLQRALGGLASIAGRLDQSELTVVVAEPDPRLDLAIGRGDEGELSEGSDGGAGASHLRSPPGPTLAGPYLALGLDPGQHVALGELHMASHTDAAGTLAVHASVVDGRDRYAEVSARSSMLSSGSSPLIG